MILNLMPCVFPVLALKVYAFINMVHKERRHLLLHAGAYTAGIVGSLLGLAAAVVALKTAGHGVGWGFQFQEPLFVAGISALLVAFAMNLFGVFEVMAPVRGLAVRVDHSHGMRRSLGEGVLAVVLATPCSAPFLGTAVGFALASSLWTIVAVFAVLGVGLALPFLLLVMLPGTAKLLPRPGPWMEHAKAGLGFSLLATVVWLIWVLGQQAGLDAAAATMAFLLGVALCAWMWGVAQHSSGRTRAVVAALAAGLLAGLGSVALPWRSEAEQALATASSEWLPFDEEAIVRAVHNGHPVFVDFTADWCISCKVNERAVIARDDVKAVFRDHNVVLFKADWTKQDERILQVLERHGKAGVPMYLLYSPHRPAEPRVLPEVLTVDLLVNEVRRAARQVL
jgi:thiol:disulfide interchange protein DsbD